MQSSHVGGKSLADTMLLAMYSLGRPVRLFLTHLKVAMALATLDGKDGGPASGVSGVGQGLGVWGHILSHTLSGYRRR
ncbi:hypothetical protein GCM10007159_24010 [Modicisalibacter luteus]|nr:hypothetical protein GCM10007159_24010 [Halomonas lutea]